MITQEHEALIRKRRQADFEPPFVVDEMNPHPVTPQRILINISIASDHGIGTDNKNIYQLQVSVPTVMQTFSSEKNEKKGKINDYFYYGMNDQELKTRLDNFGKLGNVEDFNESVVSLMDDLSPSLSTTDFLIEETTVANAEESSTIAKVDDSTASDRIESEASTNEPTSGTVQSNACQGDQRIRNIFYFFKTNKKSIIE